MRDINNLNREHDNKLKAERTTCCNCPTGKEIIFCGCDCHKQVNAFPCVECGEVYSEESGAYNGFTCEECVSKREE